MIRELNGGQGRSRTADTRIFSPVTVAGLCVTIGRYWYLFKRLTALPASRFYRFEHIETYSSGKVVAKWISFTATIVLLDDMPLFPKKCDGHLMSEADARARTPHRA